MGSASQRPTRRLSSAPSFGPSNAPTNSARPTATGGPTLSAAPTDTLAERKFDALLDGKSLLISNATKVAREGEVTNASFGLGRRCALGALLSGIVLEILQL